jgi:hypothetical protein
LLGSRRAVTSGETTAAASPKGCGRKTSSKILLVHPHPPPSLYRGRLHSRVGVLQDQFGFGLHATGSTPLVLVG